MACSYDGSSNTWICPNAQDSDAKLQQLANQGGADYEATLLPNGAYAITEVPQQPSTG